MSDEWRPRARRLQPHEREGAVATIVAAFAADPILRWIWPAELRWSGVGRAFVDKLVRVRLVGGEAWVTDDLAGVALWDPPGGLYADEPEGWEPFKATLTEEERGRMDRFVAAAEAARPPGAHWYLGVLAVRPARQGRGLSRAVLTPILGAADRTGTAMSLETGTESNLAVYERFGFRTYAQVDIPGGGPHLWVLERVGRPPGDATS